MQKIYIIKPDRIPYSLCADSYAKGFKHAGFYMEKTFSSELDNDYVEKFNPDILMCFNFNELKEGFLHKLKNNNPKCKFIFNFLVKLDDKKDAKNIKILEDFQADKIILTADKSNLNIIPNSIYIPNGINYKKYKTYWGGYKNNITIMSNPNNINVLKTIIDLIINFGQINIYSDETDYINSLENELWQEYNDYHIKELYKNSYKGEISNAKNRSEIFSSSVINIIPETKTSEGIDYRILEVCASSGFAICEENKEITRLFDVGRELETYNNKTELIDKIYFYIKNSEIASAISDNARRASVNNHSIHDRVKYILKLLEKNNH